MKISQSFLGSQDGSKFWWLPWFPANSLLCIILRYTVQCINWFFFKYDLSRWGKLTFEIDYSLTSISRQTELIKSLLSFISDTWKVEIHVKNKAINTFCYGVLISEEHVLTSSECEWTRKSDFGRLPIAKFPQIDNGSISIPLYKVRVRIHLEFEF